MDRVRRRTVFSNDELTVTAVESLELRTGKSNRRHFLIGRLQPVAVIVTTPDGTYTLDVDVRE